MTTCGNCCHRWSVCVSFRLFVCQSVSLSFFCQFDNVNLSVPVEPEMTTCGNCCHQVVEVVEELTGTGRVRAGRTGNDSTGRMGAKSAETPKTLIIIIISYLNLIKQEKYWPYVPIMRPKLIEANWTGTQSFVITFYYLLAINFGYFQWFWFVLF